MKLFIAPITALVLLWTSSAFAQGFLTFGAGNRTIWNEFTTPGVGVVGNQNIDAVLFWAASGTPDPLLAVGTAQNTPVGATQSVATNGVVSNVENGYGVYTTLLSSGFTQAQLFGNGSTIEETISTLGAIPPEQVQVAGMGLNVTYECIVVAWDAASGFDANTLPDSYYHAIGWSNPFDYETGATSTDPVGTASMNGDGLIKFGVAPVPEPGTLALTVLGGSSLLALRRRK